VLSAVLDRKTREAPLDRRANGSNWNKLEAQDTFNVKVKFAKFKGMTGGKSAVP
jgi:hypothetical protein